MKIMRFTDTKPLHTPRFPQHPANVSGPERASQSLAQNSDHGSLWSSMVTKGRQQRQQITHIERRHFSPRPLHELYAVSSKGH